MSAPFWECYEVECGGDCSLCDVYMNKIAQAEARKDEIREAE